MRSVLAGVSCVPAPAAVLAPAAESADSASTEHWNGKTWTWSAITSPADSTESLDPFGVTGTDTALTVAGARGAMVAYQQPQPGTGDNGFAAITATPGGGLRAVGVYADNGNYSTLIEHHC